MCVIEQFANKYYFINMAVFSGGDSLQLLYTLAISPGVVPVSYLRVYGFT